MKPAFLNRREFLSRTLVFGAGVPLGFLLSERDVLAAPAPPVTGSSDIKTNARVAIVPCHTYGAEVAGALDQCFDLLGGIQHLVRGKTVTVKLNLTGTDFTPFLGRPVGETFMTHYATALALAKALFRDGATRVRFVESTQSRASLESTLGFADWDLKALTALGKVEFENTRNLGSGKRYATLKLPSGGLMFSAFDLNHAYADTDVMISMAKLKNHVTAGVTLSMKNMFGLTPNSIYGSKAGDEDATEGRMPLHNPTGFEKMRFPGLKDGITSKDPTWRVPRITVDICHARPVHLAIIDGISAMKGGEGPWCGGEQKLSFTNPGVLIAGLNPVSTDAVATAVMGYKDPRAPRGVKPFENCDNHLLMAEQQGVGIADLAKIDLRGLPIAKARYPYG
ncbi:MAG TPA: DUF362 domain-containing protein [Verrucomicrobiae bacterium]|nr:DUF362 domain-containing protein [Verrucomicrobiae bacterium]